MPINPARIVANHEETVPLRKALPNSFTADDWLGGVMALPGGSDPQATGKAACVGTLAAEHLALPGLVA